MQRQHGGDEEATWLWCDRGSRPVAAQTKNRRAAPWQAYKGCCSVAAPMQREYPASDPEVQTYSSPPPFKRAESTRIRSRRKRKHLCASRRVRVLKKPVPISEPSATLAPFGYPVTNTMRPVRQSELRTVCAAGGTHLKTNGIPQKVIRGRHRPMASVARSPKGPTTERRGCNTGRTVTECRSPRRSKVGHERTCPTPMGAGLLGTQTRVRRRRHKP